MLNTINYPPFSQTAKGWTWSNVSAHSRTFDADGRVTSVSLGSVQRSYGYDSAGRLTNCVEQTAGGVVNSTMGFDEAGQLNKQWTKARDKAKAPATCERGS